MWVYSSSTRYRCPRHGYGMNVALALAQFLVVLRVNQT